MAMLIFSFRLLLLYLFILVYSFLEDQTQVKWKLNWIELNCIVPAVVVVVVVVVLIFPDIKIIIKDNVPYHWLPKRSVPGTDKEQSTTWSRHPTRQKLHVLASRVDSRGGQGSSRHRVPKRKNLLRPPRPPQTSTTLHLLTHRRSRQTHNICPFISSP